MWLFARDELFQAVETAHRAMLAEEIRNVVAVAPSRRPARVARMPDVIAAGPADDRPQLQPSVAEAVAEVVVFAAPAFVVFVEAIDPLVIVAPQAEITPQQPRLRRVMDEVIPAGLAVHLGESAAFVASDEAAIFARIN